MLLRPPEPGQKVRVTGIIGPSTENTALRAKIGHIGTVVNVTREQHPVWLKFADGFTSVFKLQELGEITE